MGFKRLSNSYLLFVAMLSFTLFSCGIDERGKLEKEKIKKQQMDSLFKDADKIPVIEEEALSADSTSAD